MHAHQQPGALHAGMNGSLQEHKGQIVGNVVSGTVNAADGQALAAPVAAIPHNDGTSVLKFCGVVQSDILDLQKLLGKILGNRSIFHVCLIEGVQPLIHATIGEGVSVALNLEQRGGNGEQLQCLPECLRRTGRNLPTVFRNRLQLTLAFGVVLSPSLFLRQICIAQKIFLACLEHHQRGLVLVSLFIVLGVLLGKSGISLIHFLDDPGISQLHQADIVYGVVSHACVMVQIGLEDLLARLRSDALGFVQAGVDIITYRLALPILAQFHQFPAVFIASHVVLIMRTFLEGIVKNFIDDPLDGKLRVNRSGLTGSGDFADDQVIVIDLKIDIFQNVLERVGALELSRAVLMLFVSLSNQPQTLQVNVIGFCKERLHQTFHAGIGRPGAVADLVADAIVFVIWLCTAGCRVNFFHHQSSSMYPCFYSLARVQMFFAHPFFIKKHN